MTGRQIASKPERLLPIPVVVGEDQTAETGRPEVWRLGKVDGCKAQKM